MEEMEVHEMNLPSGHYTIVMTDTGRFSIAKHQDDCNGTSCDIHSIAEYNTPIKEYDQIVKEFLDWRNE